MEYVIPIIGYILLGVVLYALAPPISLPTAILLIILYETRSKS